MSLVDSAFAQRRGILTWTARGEKRELLVDRIVLHEQRQGFLQEEHAQTTMPPGQSVPSLPLVDPLGT